MSDIYWLIVHNMGWLETQLDIQTTLPRNEEKVPTTFTINFLPVTPPSFNPLATFDEIGNSKFDAVSINSLQHPMWNTSCVSVSSKFSWCGGHLKLGGMASLMLRGTYNGIDELSSNSDCGSVHFTLMLLRKAGFHLFFYSILNCLWY